VADQIDRDGRLARGLVDGMVDAGLIRILLPRDLGGFQLGPLTAVELSRRWRGPTARAGWLLTVTATYRLGGCRSAQGRRRAGVRGGIPEP